MSLATRCTSCGTVFRVVQDQLKISQGWVRCGRCEEVFNALEGLFDLEREAPPPWPQAGPEGVPVYPTAQPAPKPGTAPVEDIDDTDEDGFAHARFHSELLGDSPTTLAVADTLPDTGDTAPREPAPQFVREAQRAALWRRPAVRTTLALASLVLGLSLTAQIALHFRDGLAARWPATVPALQALCESLHCRIEPPRRIDDIVVDSSGVTKLDANGLYRFSLVLRNRGDVAVMLPFIDLTLTDPQGQLIARKMLNPLELGATQRSVPPGADVPLQGVLAGGERRIVGYQVETFYP